MPTNAFCINPTQYGGAINRFSYAESDRFALGRRNFHSDFQYLRMGHLKMQFLFTWDSTHCHGNPTVRWCSLLIK